MTDANLSGTDKIQIIPKILVTYLGNFRPLEGRSSTDAPLLELRRQDLQVWNFRFGDGGGHLVSPILVREGRLPGKACLWLGMQIIVDCYSRTPALPLADQSICL